MATYNLRRFARPGALKKITPRFLVEFLSLHRDFLAAKGTQLASAVDEDSLGSDALAGLFMAPGPKLSCSDAVYLTCSLCACAIVTQFPVLGLYLRQTGSPPICRNRASRVYLPDSLA